MSSDAGQADLDEFARNMRELLETAHQSDEQPAVRDEYVEEPSRAFSRWHRTLPGWYTMIDIDWAYYYNNSREVYLFCETITVPEGALDSGVDECYAVDDHKRDVLEGLSEATGVPAAVVWHTEACDRFFVKELSDEQPEVRELVGDDGYADWIDEFRLQEATA